MLSGGIRYGHEWNWHLVKLVNAGGGHWDGAASEMTRPGGWTEVWRFGAAAANHNGSQRTIPVPVEMEKVPYGR